MYIPVINLLQFSLSSFTKVFDFVPGVDSLNANSWQRFGIVTPYHDRPQGRLWADLPSDCAVDQVMLVCVQAPTRFLHSA